MKSELLAFALLLSAPGVSLAAPVWSQQANDDPERNQHVERLRGTDVWATDFARASVPLREIVSGGPPKDGIPPIDAPRFESADEAAAWLGPADPLLVVVRGGEVRGYPLGILIWHEVVNDRVGELPVAVTFCPLCNTALVFDRRLDERVLDFGTTGRLRHSDLVMYDRQTESWWQQAVGEAIVGELTGRRLEFVAANTLGWERARTLYPEIRVLSRDTGFPSYRESGRYGQNPYRRYDSGQPYERFFDGQVAADLPAMERVVAIDEGPGWAVSFTELRRRPLVQVDVEGRPLLVVWTAGTASALDDAQIARGRDVGQSFVYDRRVDGRVLEFRAAHDDQFVDLGTGSVWDLAGRAISGSLAGSELDPVPHGNHFWFAWTAFRPETRLWVPGSGTGN